MPFALTAMGSCARLAALSKPWAAEASGCAEDLAVFARTVPMMEWDGVGIDAIEMVAGDDEKEKAGELAADGDPSEQETLQWNLPSLASILAASTTEAISLSETFFASKPAAPADPPLEKDPASDAEAPDPAEDAPRKKKRKTDKTKRAPRDDDGGADEIDAIFSTF